MRANNEKEKPGTAPGDSLLGRFAYAACATPPGASGIAVIRMAGTGAVDIADALFQSYSPEGATVREMQGYTCAYGAICDPDGKDVIDTVVLTKFTAPHSYTGEDIIEISCHGGSAVKRAILAALFSMGARPAQPGEFTKHAFLNGKIDLAQAEAVMDLIGAAASKASLEATRQMQGILSAKIRAVASAIYEVMSKIEMAVEFPEHEETDEATFAISANVRDLARKLDELVRSFRQGRVLREGLCVVIAGRPNAGKSSMLNALAGYDRAIVTDVAGTTRDTVEEMVDVAGIPVRLIDTAGLHDSHDEVEIRGIDRARKAIESADLIFWIAADDSCEESGASELPEGEEDLKEILASRGTQSLVLILGKSDLTPFAKKREQFRKIFPDTPAISFSAVTQEGIDEVFGVIRKKYEELGAFGSEEVLITNERHFYAASAAKRAADLAVEALDGRMPLDVISAALRSAADSLAEITGDEVSEELVNEIFSRFCIGK